MGIGYGKMMFWLNIRLVKFEANHAEVLKKSMVVLCLFAGKTE